MNRNPMVKPKAHLHVFYCAVMHYAIDRIKRGLLPKTFKYEQVVQDPNAVLMKLLTFADVAVEDTEESRERIARVSACNEACRKRCRIQDEFFIDVDLVRNED